MIVFVHGVPETQTIWNELRANLNAESVALSMPGFGCARPLGFSATKDEYVDWLVGELDQFDEPIDLVGHDWGAGLTYRVATAYGNRLRSWSADVANIVHPDYVWHEYAQIWQTPGDGEAFFANPRSAQERGPGLEMLGVPHDDAVTMAEASDETMGACILDLYRSATPNLYAHWGDAFRPTFAPGMVMCPSEDPFGDAVKSREVAAMLGARHQMLDGLGHWWPLQAPERCAELLNEFIASIG
ncbi:MAG TPA: alpha/beta hydrolase [Acidimicrobiales bacterium]|nr:alpha/beta hydrolase [Acidimicrobiales bacterium]